MIRSLVDARFLAVTVAAGFVALIVFGLVSAIIPNPVFGRQIAAEPFAIGVWLASAPLVGLLAATYLVPPRTATSAAPLGPESSAVDPGSGSFLGTLGGFGAFLAIGCPVCNKVVLVLLGTSGALNVWAPLQPLLGAVSLALIGATLAWRLRIRSRAGACPVAPAS